MVPTKALMCLIVCAIVSNRFMETIAATQATSSENRKAMFISEMLMKHPHLADQIWDIGFTVMLNSIGHNHQDKNTTKMFMDYALDNLPRLLKNKDFKNMVTDVSTEFIAAYNRAQISGNIILDVNNSGVGTDKMSHKDVMNVLKHLNVSSLVQKALKNGKPVIDAILSADSTPFLPIINEGIKMLPAFWNSQPFQRVKGAVLKELVVGYLSASRDMSMMNIGGSQNTTALIINILKHTNMPRLMTEILQAVKPLIDMVTGKDSTEMLTGIGFLAKVYPKLTASNLYQNVKKVTMKHFWETFHRLNLTKNDLKTNTNNVIQNVISNTSKLTILQDVLRGNNARNIMPKPAGSSINGKCYSNTMDALDSLVNMAPWAIKSKLVFYAFHSCRNVIGVNMPLSSIFLNKITKICEVHNLNTTNYNYMPSFILVQ